MAKWFNDKRLPPCGLVRDRLFILTFLDIEIFFFFEKIDIEIDLSRIIVNFDDSDVKLFLNAP